MLPPPAFHTTIPFTLVDNRILVDATVNGKRFAMIVDTGSPGVTLTPQDVTLLRLHTTPAPSVGGAGAGVARAQLTKVSDLLLGTYHTGSQPALVLNLERIRTTFHFTRLDGIIGYDMLGGKYVGIDMKSHTLTLSSTPLAAPSGGRTVAYHLDNGLMVVDSAVDGVHGPAILDTGDRSEFTVFGPFARANNFYDLSQRRHDVMTGVGIGGPIYGDVFESTIDAFGFTAMRVVTRAPIGPSGAFDSPRYLGSIGEGLLRRYDLLFDAPAQTITAWPIDAEPAGVTGSYTLPRHATFGAVFGSGGRGASIAHVLPGGPAAAAGLQNGDVVTALGGEPTPGTAALLAALHPLHAGDRAQVDFYRGVELRTTTVAFVAPPEESDANVTTTYDAILVDGTLRRTLVTMPKNATGRLPAMLLIGRIGCYSVDVASNPQDPYLRLAHDVASAGFVTMRVEKSGVGDSEGPPCARVDFDAELRAYTAALEALRGNPRVNPARMYLFGHSIGTLEAPILANDVPVAGVVVAEAVGRDWPEYHVDASYMQQVARVHSIGEWEKLSVPVLAIYGSSDFVTEKADHERIVDAVNARHAGTASFEEINGMDYLLDIAPTPEAAMEAFSKALPRTYDSALSNAVVRWLLTRV